MTKTKGDEFLEAVVTETGGQTSPRLSLLPKRKRDDADQCLTSDADSIAKERRSINVNEKLIVSFKSKLIYGSTHTIYFKSMKVLFIIKFYDGL